METILSINETRKVSKFDNANIFGLCDSKHMVSEIRNKARSPAKLYLREWRESAGLSQDQLAARLDTSKSVGDIILDKPRAKRTVVDVKSYPFG